MSLADEITKLEKYYFDKHVTEELLEQPYIASNTWRGFSSTFKTKDAASHALLYSYDHITLDLEAFLDANAAFDRDAFDACHHKQVEDLRIHLNIQPNGDRVTASSKGDYYGCAYNSYAKVVDLANKHWFAKVLLSRGKNKYTPRLAELRTVLHAPLDMQALTGLRNLLARNEMPTDDLPNGGMATVKSQEKYATVQGILRALADDVPSARFDGEPTAALVFDAYWPMSL
jgi:hypothetical protein